MKFEYLYIIILKPQYNRNKNSSAKLSEVFTYINKFLIKMGIGWILLGGVYKSKFWCKCKFNIWI